MLGYFLETSAGKAEPLLRPPLSALFIHRQTLANQVRFTTVELAELDARIAHAADRALAIELEIFEAWRGGGARRWRAPIQAAAEALARARRRRRHWPNGPRRPARCGPRSTARWSSRPRRARHPVVEAAVRRAGDRLHAQRLPRSTRPARRRARLSIVTGPNMAGKSTFLRQNALLAILAQAGCFVPAKSLRLGVVDRLFSRVGAGDDLARGRSTFMAEMVETAAILTQATPRSFVILDEIGRGTATYDGLAIAWACAEALHDVNRCRALFATHYHELATLEERLAHVSNLSLQGQGVERRPGLPARGRARAAPTAPTACRWPSWPACRPPWSPGRARCWTGWRARRSRTPASPNCRCSPPPRRPRRRFARTQRRSRRRSARSTSTA